MKKGMAILGVLLLLLIVAVLLQTNQPVEEMGSPSFIKILGMTTNPLPRRCLISITNTTGGEMVFAPMETIVETVGGWKTTSVDGDAFSKQTGYNGVFSNGQVRTIGFPVPEGAIRWKVRFVMSAQTTTSRIQDTIHNMPQKIGVSRSGQWTSFGTHATYTTGELPP
jgi:hypothetical protein